MKIGFVNFTPMVYDVETPLIEPLGGSESAMCYLAVQLALLGHHITLFRRAGGEFTKKGVKHLPLNKIAGEPLDILIVQNTPSAVVQIKNVINSKTRIILWSQHASDQPAVECLNNKEVQNSFDKIVLISKWQEEDYINAFNIKKSKICILRNAISPAFENLKGNKIPYSMAYTSTPFRGLSLLPEIFSIVKKDQPKANLSIFSSMKVYQASKEGEAEYEALYEACRKIEGIEYVGSLSQQDLSKQMKNIAILAYPNVFPETSCIGVMEAMAAGCQVVTSDLGALPETTAGFGRLVSIIGRNKEEYMQDFIKELLKPINREKIKEQIAFVNKNYTWKIRAKEWEKMLEEALLDIT